MSISVEGLVEILQREISEGISSLGTQAPRRPTALRSTSRLAPSQVECSLLFDVREDSEPSAGHGGASSLLPHLDSGAAGEGAACGQGLYLRLGYEPEIDEPISTRATRGRPRRLR